MAERDIVERLREHAAFFEAHGDYASVLVDCEEAADEIERLRLTILGLARIAKSVVSD